MSDVKFLNDFLFNTDEILEDYFMAVMSREVSDLGRKEVIMGKAKFGIFGGGKEVAQVAMARFFKKGDFITFEPGSSHFSYTKTGCLLLVFQRARNELLKE